MNKPSAQRRVIEQRQARPAADGDGVKLLRVFGGQSPERFDPFLLMDEFGSDEAADYIGGFPAHPHRGFETISYMLQGKMEHQDHMGNVGLLKDGDVQWMTAGRGVIHSEMPQQTEGKMRGFQVWLNLPSTKKMSPPRYQDVPASDLPHYRIDGAGIIAISGNASIGEQGLKGFFDVPDTDAIYLDIHLEAQADIALDIPAGYTTLLYQYEGQAQIGGNAVPSSPSTLSRFDDEGALRLKNSDDEEARFILLAGQAIKEPIAQHGPFVMNTSEEINQAMDDYRAGLLTA